MAVALLAITAVAPVAVLADNMLSFVDAWPVFDLAVFAGMATPFIFWAAKRFPPPPPGPPPPPPGPDPEWEGLPPSPPGPPPPPPGPDDYPGPPPPDYSPHNRDDDWADELEVQR